MSLSLDDLHPIYRSVRPHEARLIANLGAEVYLSVRDPLRTAWASELSAEESTRADVWRKEGRLAAVEEMRGSLAEAEALAVRLAAAEGTVAALRASVDAEVSRRLGQELDGMRATNELTRLKETETLRAEVSELKQTVAAAAARESYVRVLEDANALMREKLDGLEEKTKTKTSTHIGKEGEATVWEMLETVVVPEFPYAEVTNMTGVSHAADFHLCVMGAAGQRLKILIDSKKYKRAVNSDEIHKLVADVDADEEAHAGMMISLVSPICTTKQFQIRASTKGKPILYLSFCEVDEGQQAQILCWAVRALMSAIPREKAGLEIQRMDELLNEIGVALKDVDGMVKSHQKMIDGLRGMKMTILNKMGDFRGEAVTSGCVAVLKSTGEMCGRPVVGDGVKCRSHTR
jgi:phage-related protein